MITVAKATNIPTCCLGNFKEGLLNNKIIGRNISILYRHEIVYVDMKLKEHNLNKIQAEFILFLKHYGDVNQTDLNKYFMFNKATITKIIKHLEQFDFVTSCINKRDKREKIISLEDKGIKIVPLLKQVLGEWESNILDTIPINDIETARNVLALMVENMVKENKELK